MDRGDRFRSEVRVVAGGFSVRTPSVLIALAPWIWRSPAFAPVGRRVVASDGTAWIGSRLVSSLIACGADSRRPFRFWCVRSFSVITTFGDAGGRSLVPVLGGDSPVLT